MVHRMSAAVGDGDLILEGRMAKNSSNTKSNKGIFIILEYLQC